MRVIRKGMNTADALASFYDISASGKDISHQ